MAFAGGEGGETTVIYGFLGMVITAAFAGIVQGVRGWKSVDPNEEPRKGGKVEEEKYKKVVIERAELADLSSIRALPGRLDKLSRQLAENNAIMLSVKDVVTQNHAIMVLTEGLVKQNNQILLSANQTLQTVNEIRDMLANAAKVAETLRIERLADRMAHLDTDHGRDRR